MTSLYLYDDARARTFEPFASTRPISEMMAGVALIRDRWRALLQPRDVHFLAGERHLAFDEGTDTCAADGKIPAGSIIANARCVPAIPKEIPHSAQRAATCSMWRSGDRLSAVRVKEAVDAGRFLDGTLDLDQLAAGTGAIGDTGGWWLDEVWDFIRLLPAQLAADIPLAVQAGLGWHSSGHTGLASDTTILGEHPVHIAPEAVVEPRVVFDASDGPIMVARDAHIRAFSRIVGPCYIGRGSTVMGGDVTACAIGAVSKVRGELSNTIVLGYSNKGHDGFVGHSYLGRWVNLGAGTITSNLKNTYGTVALWTPSGVRDTGMQFLGTLFGDHVKTGIGLRLTTGTVLGAGANVYGNMPPKAVAPFSWGDAPPYDTYRVDKFLETAGRMMGRRHVELTDRARRHLTAVHSGRWTVDSEAT